MNPRIPSQGLHRLHPAPQIRSNEKSVQTNSAFDNLLRQEMGPTPGLKVSKHAQERLIERNIEIDGKKWQAIENQMNAARKKGVTDSVVITDRSVLIVNTKNNTVITAMGRDEASAHIFTNINGTIVMD
ncbi:MAG TPA: TIGR02530 family flagellar biosynthesis protein [Bacillales bacterium]|nr:TIGR02530 family flagellar biosynthesis protein [Bacillales bacterium]